MKPYYESENFKLYHGDCLEAIELLPVVDMVFADPPYNLSNGGFTCKGGRMVSVNKGDWDKSKGPEEDHEFTMAWLTAAQKSLAPNGSLWVSGTYHNIYNVGFALQKLQYHILNEVSWFKPNASPNLSCRMFTASHETLIWARPSKSSKHTFNYSTMREMNGGKQMRSVWTINSTPPSEKKFGKHPTQKPLDLMRRVILASTQPGDTILDPFNGSGSTGVAAIELGRKYIGIDMDKNYLDLTIIRINALNNEGNIKTLAFLPSPT